MHPAACHLVRTHRATTLLTLWPSLSVAHGHNTLQWTAPHCVELFFIAAFASKGVCLSKHHESIGLTLVYWLISVFRSEIPLYMSPTELRTKGELRKPLSFPKTIFRKDYLKNTCAPTRFLLVGIAEKPWMGRSSKRKHESGSKEGSTAF